MTVDNVLKSAGSWQANLLFSKGFGGAVPDRHFYSNSGVAKKTPLNNKWQLLKEMATLFYLGSLSGMQQELNMLLMSLLTSRVLVLELDAPSSAEVCAK